ncbi:MAG: hypothetical protein ACT4ON_12215 [Bacteroidota bacterium]
MFCKLALLLSVELFVLIAAIFLLVYITKQQVSKWFTYGSVAIVITILGLMICSACCAICCRGCGPNKMKKECRVEAKRCTKMMMRNGCSEGMMMREDNCCKKEKACRMEEECEMKTEACCKGKDEKMIKVCIKDSLPKKEVIIKK